MTYKMGKRINSNIYDVEGHIERFEKKYTDIDSVLKCLFKNYCHNTCFQEVLLKVLAINTFYTTHISGAEIIPLTSHIVNIYNLDELLVAGDLSAYHKISITPKKINNAYVFASKYCHFHNPKKYPIFDSKSRKTLYMINKKENFVDEFPKEKLSDYKFYKDCVDTLIGAFNKKYDYKKLDEFLWQYCDEKKL